MGAKLFAWLGGLAGFLAVAFFVKYSFEHDLVPPEVRVAIGFLTGAALIVGGLFIKRPALRLTAQVLCATGVVSLYAVTFACNGVYHFAAFGPVATFLLMALITAAAFLLAVRMDAQVVALLGLLGGFLTPILLSTGHDNPPGLFGYIALLDAGLLAVALHRRWFNHIALAAAGTVLMQCGWAARFFNDTKAGTAAIVCLGFSALFFAASEAARRLSRNALAVAWSAAAFPLLSFAFVALFLQHDALGARPGLLFVFLFAADLLLLALGWREPLLGRLHLVAGAIVFALLAWWTGAHLTTALLPWGLAAYLGFAILHTAFPLVLARVRADAGPMLWSQLFPPLTLLLLFGPLIKFDHVSLLFWPAVLAVDVIAVALALFSASLTALAIVLVLTLASTAVCLAKPAGVILEPAAVLLVLGGFGLFFFGAGLFLSRRLGSRLGNGDTGRASAVLGDARAQIPAFSALLPFILLVMMSQRLDLPNPSSLFGLALLFTVLVLGLARLLTIAWLPACALAGVAAVEAAWHARHFSPAAAAAPLAWYLGFYLLFAAYPFLSRRRFTALTGPWAVAALSGIVQFPLVYRLVDRAWPNDLPGLLAALFALAPLLSLAAIARTAPATPADTAPRLNQLAWFGGAALAFITLVFPLQFDRQWITISWALEGAALLWLFHRVPHPGLRATGVALLVTAFVRLALNPAVLAYHARSDTPIFNWYLYAYGLVLGCQFAGARLLAPPRERVLGSDARPILQALGTILAFLLLNLEIADYFSPAGGTLTFQFSGFFARDLAYTIGWALFALALLGAGIWKKARPARYAAIGLLCATLLKLFFHDLAQLGQLYRVGALVAVAAVAILASFLYQRFVPADDPAAPPAP